MLELILKANKSQGMNPELDSYNLTTSNNSHFYLDYIHRKNGNWAFGNLLENLKHLALEQWSSFILAFLSCSRWPKDLIITWVVVLDHLSVLDTSLIYSVTWKVSISQQMFVEI